MADRNNPDFLSASTIKKDKVVNSAGDDLGKIEELMFDLDNGRVGYAVLSFGGTLGLGAKLFAIPWQALSLRLHEHAFTLDIPRDVLEKAEGFDKDNWPVTREELSRTYNYYGYQPYWQTGATGQTGQAGASTGAQSKIESQGPASPGSRENPDFLSANSIKSDKVVNRNGDNIGKIEELMIDLEDGRIGYVVLSHGGFLGIGNKLFAIPWQALKLRPHEHAFLLDIPKETLDKAEGFDKDKWPLTRGELSSIYTYYGYQPYWQTGAVPGAAAAAAAAAAGTAGISTGMQGETESERKARMERERQTAAPKETEPERTAGMERERLTGMPEIGPETVTRKETEIREPAETEAERKARQERERLESLRKTEEEKVSQLEKQRMEKERQAQAERECLARLEKERSEAERQAEAEREKLARLERELQEATRREKTEEVTRLEKEMREVKTKEEAQRQRVTQLEKERTEVERQAQAERERLEQLEKERMEAEKREETEKEKFAQIEKKRTEAQTLEETEKETLARLEKERTETERQAQTERERLTQLERERMEAERKIETKPRRESPDFLPASTIKGYKVVNTNGDNLGRIEELMIDLQNGRVAYAALSLGGFLGMSDKLFAVPWQTLSYIPDEQAFILAVPRNILEKAESFDKDKCPTTREGLSRTYTYYGYRPYWETGAARYGGRLETAEEVMAGQEKETIEELEKKETDPEKLARLERERMIAERREHKYD